MRLRKSPKRQVDLGQSNDQPINKLAGVVSNSKQVAKVIGEHGVVAQKSTVRRASNMMERFHTRRIKMLAPFSATMLERILKFLELYERDDLDEIASKALIQIVEKLAIYFGWAVDELTQLPQWMLFQAHFKAVANSGKDIAICYLDLDKFKLVNDRFSHDVGNEVLVEVGRRLKSKLRSGDDRRDGDYVARLSGGADEFVVLFAAPGGDSESQLMAIRLEQELKQPYVVAGKEIHLEVTIGFIWTRHPAKLGLDNMVTQAEIAVNQRKSIKEEALVPRVYRYSDAMWQKVVEIEARKEALRQAILNGELKVLFQPVVRLEDETVVGFEAFPDPEAFKLDPKQELNDSRRQMRETIEEIEAENSCHAMTERMMAEVAGFLQRSGDKELYVSVNVTIQQLMSKRFLEFAAELWQQHDLKPEQLAFELVERYRLDWGVEEALTVDRVLTAGFRLLFDDYCQGYSNPATLSRFLGAFQGVKLDSHFVRLLEPKSRVSFAPLEILPETDEDETLKEHVRHLVAAATALRRPDRPMTIIAEGITSRSVANELEAMDVEYGQGFLWGDKLSADDALEFYRQHRRP